VTPEQYTKVRRLSNRLIASCDGGRDESDEVAALTQEECKLLDTMALECSVCNQWSDAHEFKDTGGQWVCNDCTE
jgi:hypothetical protein